MVTGTEPRRAGLRRKYQNLGVGELAAAAIFAWIALTQAFAQLSDRDRLALTSALIPLLVILVQAGVYWLLARSWVMRHPMPGALAGIYRFFRVLDAVLLLVGLVGVIVWLPGQPLVAAVIVAVWAFGALEYVNYFVVRLAYPPSQWFSIVGQWRRPTLVTDMTARGRSRR